MQLEFIPIEEFYFALTLSVRTLEELGDPAIVAQVRSQLEHECGRPSTVAAAQQNSFNYVFRVQNYDNSPAEQLIVSIADWQDKLRLSTDYGWMLDQSRKPVRTEKFAQREQFAQDLRSHLQAWLGITLPSALS
jgi:outer membrane protein assembly factor BamE (lipoprotein component of BamABCDE complex)